MRDHCCKSVTKENTIYKDVVVVGNGPSGISLSFMLSGNWPYWMPEKLNRHPDELLRARLDYEDSTRSLVEHDLIELAQGLEGRSTNPVSLLLDSLQHPCADLGMELPAMVEYKFNPGKQIEHVVLGNGPPGGSWHRMDPNLRTLSLSSWMSLPGYSFGDWEQKHHQATRRKTKCDKCAMLRTKIESPFDNNNESESATVLCRCSRTAADVVAPKMVTSLVQLHRRNLSVKRGDQSTEVQTRALISRVAEYYESYVREMGLDRHFVNDAVVTSVVPMKPSWLTSSAHRFREARWIVTGFHKTTHKTFNYLCKNLVLANGASDMANRLGLKGEGLASPWLKHELPQLEVVLERLSDEERALLKPVLIVGAGLSAADAITICRSSRIPVIHVYRNRSAGLDKMLPENVYPEYHEIQKMMKNPQIPYDNYTPLPEHTISDVSPSSSANKVHRVTVQNLKTGELRELNVSFCAILIGSRPNLHFVDGQSFRGVNKCGSEHTEVPDLELHATPNTDSNSKLLSKRISWLKNICAKCRHINLCDRTKRAANGDFNKRTCGHMASVFTANTEIKSPAEDLALTAGLGFGEDATRPVDCKTNPIAVDKFTNAVHGAPRGLYAMGPLVGDNFVRFIPGGALTITAALHKTDRLN